MRVLKSAIVSCRACPRLVAWRESVEPRAAFRGEEYWRRPVPGFGDRHASVVVVGLAPAAHGANRTGRMFTGDRSGDWLVRAMFKAGFSNQAESTAADDGLRLTGAWVTAAVRCAPPGNAPTAEERSACMAYLEEELGLLRDARVIVALGGVACDAVARIYGVSPRPRFSHLAEHVLTGSKVLLCSYHPSQRNTSTRTLTEPMLDAVFARARALVDADVRQAGGPEAVRAWAPHSRASASG